MRRLLEKIFILYLILIIFINDVIFLDSFCLQKLLDILAFQKLKEILELFILSIFIWRFANVSTIFQK